MDSFRDNSPVKSPSKSQRVAETQSEIYRDMESIRPPKLKLDIAQPTPARKPRKSIDSDYSRDPFAHTAETLDERWPTLEFDNSSTVDPEEVMDGAEDEAMDQSPEEIGEESLEQTDHKERVSHLSMGLGFKLTFYSVGGPSCHILVDHRINTRFRFYSPSR
jgi:hypothetical protein